jgi:ribonucleoside-triphosphate reductase
MKMILKRDGRRMKFDKEKIVTAIKGAFENTEGEVYDEYAETKAKNIADYVEQYVNESDKMLSVEEIQDLIEKGLMSCKKKDVAKQYILYRAERTRERNRNSAFNKIISEKLTASNVVNQNANVDEYSFGGRTGEASSELSKMHALDNLVSEKFRRLHEENILYIHDLSSYSVGNHNCLTVPIDDLLANGFDTRQTDVRPANSINTALQLVAVLFQIQSLQQFGGVSAGHLDWSLVPYVRKSFYKHFCDGAKYILGDKKFSFENIEDDLDENERFVVENESINSDLYKDYDSSVYRYALDMTTKETYQAVEGLYHNLNTLQSRSGNQLPFSSVNFGTCTLPEGRLIIKAMLDTSIKGIGKLHRTSVFPCTIFQVMSGVNKEPNTPNYDLYRLALQSTAKRLYPNYANIDWSVNAGYDKDNWLTYVSTMGCRTYNGFDMNGFGQLKDGRGNIAPNTIILPKLAMLAKGEVGNKDIDDFMNILDKTIFDARDQLIERYKWICSQDPRSASFMYENGTMKGYIPEEGIRSALKHGTLAIGQIGLAETLQILIGCDHTEERGMELAKRIEQLFKDRCYEFKHELRHDEDGYEYYLNFGVYYTPAENLCYTAMKKFKNEFGEIPKVSDKTYFTNSIHVPVNKQMNAFEKINIESELTGYSSAGCITYIEADRSIMNNIDALDKVVQYAMDKDIPYFAINVKNDQCMDCGFIGVIDVGDKCPKCGSENIKRLRRITGYLTNDYLTSFNKGKVDETEDRVVHLDNHEFSI